MPVIERDITKTRVPRPTNLPTEPCAHPWCLERIAISEYACDGHFLAIAFPIRRFLYSSSKALRDKARAAAFRYWEKYPDRIWVPTVKKKKRKKKKKKKKKTRRPLTVGVDAKSRLAALCVSNGGRIPFSRWTEITPAQLRYLGEWKLAGFWEHAGPIKGGKLTAQGYSHLRKYLPRTFDSRIERQISNRGGLTPEWLKEWRRKREWEEFLRS